MRKLGFMFGLVFLVAPLMAAAQDGAPTSQPAATTPAPPVTDAERIARLQRSIEQSEARLQMLRGELEDPQAEYNQAEKAFGDIDKQLDDLKHQLAEAQEGGKSDEVQKLTERQSELQKRWRLARERFDLAIAGRKTKQQEVTTLENKVREERAALDRLKGVTPAAASQPTATSSAQPTTAEASPPPAQPAEQAAPAISPTGIPIPTPSKPPASQPAAGAPSPAKSEAVRKAEAKAEEKKAAAAEAEIEAKSIADRIQSGQKEIELKREQLKTLRKQADNALAAVDELKRQLTAEQKKASPSASEIAKLRDEISTAEDRYAAARADARAASDDLSELQTNLAELQSEQIVALQAAEQKRAEATRAEKKLQALQNPFSPRNILQWVIDHGPKLAFIVVGMVAFFWLAHRVESRIVALMTMKPGRGSYEERKNRAQTLVGAFHYAATVAVVVGGILMILQETGVSVAPLLGGAAVIGLAVAFGAQNLIRDYFTGFLILMENQYGVNDVVRIGDTSGLVERITLRTTVLRDLEGIVHFIPNGEIKQVSNMTHGWSRALFDIGVAYKEDVDRVMKLLVEIAEELREDPAFSTKIIDEPNMLGVDQFGDSAVVIKFYMKTRPLKQWDVKREMLRRIKKRFDAEGIEIPFPHRTLFHHYEDGTPMVEPAELAAMRSEGQG